MKKCLTVFLAIPLLVMCSGQNKDQGKDQMKPTLTNIQIHVFNQYCSSPGCHGGMEPQDELNLTEGESYKSLVNVPSIQVQDLLLVDPGHPDKSYLIDKLEGVKVVGERMPMGAPPLPNKDIEVIREWIKDGAKDN